VIKVIEKTAKSIREWHAIEIEALEMDKNHIHLLSSSNPTRSDREAV